MMMLSTGCCSVKQTPGKLTDQEQFRLCGKLKPTVQHLIARCQKLEGREYVKRHDNV